MAKEEPGNFVRLSLRYYQKNSQLKTIGADLSDDELEILINELREKSETLLLQKLEAEKHQRLRAGPGLIMAGNKHWPALVAVGLSLADGGAAAKGTDALSQAAVRLLVANINSKAAKLDRAVP
jgi:hypothetical protein